jgi:hypothetical protein
MKTSSSFLLTLLLFAGQLHAGGGGGNDQGYNTEEFKYQTRPDPTRERFFGCIGTTGLKVRVYPGVVLKVEEMMPGSPCEGKFAKQEILTGINGTDLKGLDPFVGLSGRAIAEPVSPWRMRLAFSSVMLAELPIEEVCARAAQMGFGAIDIWCPS